MSSPRTWGCFSSTKTMAAAYAVFPTHVGVFPRLAQVCLPGLGLPHARGGVSQLQAIHKANGPSSPRTWGCFYITFGGFESLFVFPTHVGVFLRYWIALMVQVCLPHARGGVSNQNCGVINGFESSPRTWGCFYLKLLIFRLKKVFPTHVGVFPWPKSLKTPRQRLPHARGGVSALKICPRVTNGSSPRTWGCFLAKAQFSQLWLVFPTHVGVFLH